MLVQRSHSFFFIVILGFNCSVLYPINKKEQTIQVESYYFNENYDYSTNPNLVSYQRESPGDKVEESGDGEEVIIDLKTIKNHAKNPYSPCCIRPGLISPLSTIACSLATCCGVVTGVLILIASGV